MRESKFTARAPRTPRNAKEISLVAAEPLGVKSSTPFCGRRALQLDIPQAISRNSVYTKVLNPANERTQYEESASVSVRGNAALFFRSRVSSIRPRRPHGHGHRQLRRR